MYYSTFIVDPNHMIELESEKWVKIHYLDLCRKLSSGIFCWFNQNTRLNLKNKNNQCCQDYFFSSFSFNTPTPEVNFVADLAC